MSAGGAGGVYYGEAMNTTQTATRIVSNARLSEAVLANNGYRLGRHVARRYRAASVERCMEILSYLVPAGPWQGQSCTGHGSAACHRTLLCHVETSETSRYLAHPAVVEGVRRGVESVRAGATA